MERVSLEVVMQKPKYYGVRKIAKAFDYFYERLGEEIEGMDDNQSVQKLLEMSRLLCTAVFGSDQCG